MDAAETDEAQADAINHQGVRNSATALQPLHGRLVQVSTDYVFSGDAAEPYDVDAPVGPTGAYGRTKLAGEVAALSVLPDRAHVIRTAWVYGGPGPNFVDTMLRLADEGNPVDVVHNQVGSPTYVRDLAGALIDVGRRADVAPGVLHYANDGQASWFELAREVFRLHGADPDRVRPTDSAAFARPARRPAWSVLSVRAWTAAGLRAPRRGRMRTPPHWRAHRAGQCRGPFVDIARFGSEENEAFGDRHGLSRRDARGAMAELGHEVVGVDIDAIKIDRLAGGSAFLRAGLPELLASTSSRARCGSRRRSEAAAFAECISYASARRRSRASTPPISPTSTPRFTALACMDGRVLS